MAEKKNFIIENYNGTDYDTLYPETNSGQVLLDTEAQVSTNLESGATLDDALKNISQSSAAFQVGDTLTTARTNLDDKWALCNNELLAFSEYPELKGLLPKSNFDFLKIGNPSTGIAYNETMIATNADKESEQFLVVFGSGNGNALYYGNNLINNPAWTRLSSIGRDRGYVKYLNGIWFTYGETDYIKYYSGDLASAKFVNVYGDIYNVDDIVYENEKYYIYARNIVYIYTSLTEPAIQITIPQGGIVLCPIPQGILVPSYPTDNHNVIIAPDNTTSKIQFISPYSSDAVSIHFVIYYKDKYYVVYGYGANPTTYRLGKTTDLTVKLEQVSYEDGTAVEFRYPIRYSRTPIVTDDGVVFPEGIYIDENGIAHKWDNDVSAEYMSNIAIGADNYYLITRPTSSTEKMVAYVYKQLIAPSAKLPSVSIADNLYTYMKVKSKNSCTLTVNVTPDDAAIEVKDSAGNVVTPKEGTTNVFILTDITGEYTITASKDGYTSQTMTIINAKNQEVNITLQQE